MRPPSLQRQRGVAVITALLLTTLAITIVASLFWQQQVQVRSIENQRMQLQKQWILRGALDWASLILREDMKHSSTDDLTEDWAVPLADTPLDQYVENGRADTDASEASLSGLIVDAQSRYNLRNLSANGAVNPHEMAVFGRLLTNLNLNPALAKATAEAIAAVETKAPAFPGTPPPSSSGTTSATTASTASPAKRPMDIVQVDDLLSIPGFTPDILAKLKDFVIVLPRTTQVNANTATAQVLAAKIDGLSLSDANALITNRNHAVFRDNGDVQLRINNPKITVSGDDISVRSDYFLVNGKVSLSRASLSVQALIQRNLMGGNTIIWIREN
ncbi:MAG: type II secretion system minor pseudopilin GspK [Burkholderiaceae bacterium]